MPHLRMFLGEQQIDEVFIPEVLLNGTSLNRLIEEEKQNLIDKHVARLRTAQNSPSFYIELVPSKINAFTPLQLKKESSGSEN
jgi:hypothetical protein